MMTCNHANVYTEPSDEIPTLKQGTLPDADGINTGQDLPERQQWRRGRDSNPGYPFGYSAFRVRCLKPTRPPLLLLLTL